MTRNLDAVIAVVARARGTVPWPERDTLPDGSKVYSGLTDDQVNKHLAQEIIRELLAVHLPDDLVNRAGHAVFVAESNVLGLPVVEDHYRAAVPTYRSAALSGFQGILRELLKS